MQQAHFIRLTRWFLTCFLIQNKPKLGKSPIPSSLVGLGHQGSVMIIGISRLAVWVGRHICLTFCPCVSSFIASLRSAICASSTESHRFRQSQGPMWNMLEYVRGKTGLLRRSRHIAHFRNSTKPVNMSIFRSPGGRTVHPNRNSYDSSTYSWKWSVTVGKEVFLRRRMLSTCSLRGF